MGCKVLVLCKMSGKECSKGREYTSFESMEVIHLIYIYIYS